MSQAAIYLSFLLLTLLATFHLGRTWVEEGIDEQFYSLSVTDATGQSIPMSSYVGKLVFRQHEFGLFKLFDGSQNAAVRRCVVEMVLLIVNVASECGYTHTHYLDLVNLQSDLEFTGLFHVLAFPCNQFGQQEPQDIGEIVKFTSNVYSVNFRLFDKVDIIGDTASSLWTFLKEKTGRVPQWNFWKYLVDHRGNVIGAWGPQTSVRELSTVVREAVGAARSHTTEQPFSDNDSPSHPNVLREL